MASTQQRAEKRADGARPANGTGTLNQNRATTTRQKARRWVVRPVSLWPACAGHFGGWCGELLTAGLVDPGHLTMGGNASFLLL